MLLSQRLIDASRHAGGLHRTPPRTLDDLGDPSRARASFPQPSMTREEAAAELARALDPTTASVLRDETADALRDGEDGLSG